MQDAAIEVRAAPCEVHLGVPQLGRVRETPDFLILLEVGADEELRPDRPPAAQPQAEPQRPGGQPAHLLPVGRQPVEGVEEHEEHAVLSRKPSVARGEQVVGFVTMADRRDAPKAIEALHGAEIKGRNIVVNVATERQR